MSAGTVIIETRPCMVCGRRSRVIMTAAQAEALNANAPVQDVFPDAPRAEREVILYPSQVDGLQMEVQRG